MVSTGFAQVDDFTATERAEIDKFLTKHKSFGGDVKAVNQKGDTLLHIATFDNWDVAVVKYLVSEGADVHAKGAFGSTPLHYATRNTEVVNSTFANLGSLHKLREHEFSDVGLQKARHPVARKGVQ